MDSFHIRHKWSQDVQKGKLIWGACIIGWGSDAEVNIIDPYRALLVVYLVCIIIYLFVNAGICFWLVCWPLKINIFCNKCFIMESLDGRATPHTWCELRVHSRYLPHYRTSAHINLHGSHRHMLYYIITLYDVLGRGSWESPQMNVIVIQMEKKSNSLLETHVWTRIHYWMTNLESSSHSRSAYLRHTYFGAMK